MLDRFGATVAAIGFPPQITLKQAFADIKEDATLGDLHTQVGMQHCLQSKTMKENSKLASPLQCIIIHMIDAEALLNPLISVSSPNPEHLMLPCM